jgi:transcriptional regulator with GAF, ATPase, and Fis domain
MREASNINKPHPLKISSAKSGTEYRKTIAELEERLKLQELISRIASIFIDLPANQVDGQIGRGLKQIVEFLGVDRCAFGQFSEDMKQLFRTHSYQKPGIEPLPLDMLTDALPYYAGILHRGGIFVLENSSDLPDEAVAEKAYCQQTGMKSNLTIPVSVGGSLVGGIGFDTFHNYRSWPEELIEQLKRVAEIFVQAIYRKRTEEKLKNQFEFEKLVSHLSARFVNIPPAEVDRQIEEGLRMLVEFLGVDRGTLLKFSQGKKELIATHAYAVEGVAQVERVALQDWFPWAAAKILRGETFYFSSTNDLPEEAALDREKLKKLGIMSNITIPLFVDGAVEYALTAGAAKQEQSWPEEIIPRLRLIGEIFVNALVRKANAEELRSAYNEIARLSEQLKRENIYLQEEIKASYDFEEMVGQSGGLKYLFYRIKQVAPTDATVLIEGETGSGKELIARALHQFSSRKDRPLIKVDCSSLPANLIESELFGHEKGAFTGAYAQRIGRFELADGATVFLDEISELPLELQSKLLRVMESGEFERLGSSHTLKVNARIIAATNRHLKEEAKKGNFREDLYYRLNVFLLTLPPLRERKEDIAALTEVFVRRFAKKFGKNITTIPRKVLTALQNYSWPGNVRELENVIERAVITTEGSVLQLMDTLEDPQEIKAASAPKLRLEERERDYIIEVLEKTYWRIEGKNGAAAILGLHPATLRSRMKRLGIRRPSPSTH